MNNGENKGHNLFISMIKYNIHVQPSETAPPVAPPAAGIRRKGRHGELRMIKLSGGSGSDWTFRWAREKFRNFEL